jgi:hypothetical protein
MDFMLSIHGENNIVDALFYDLHQLDATFYASDRCLCNYDAREMSGSLPEVVIYHPLRELGRRGEDKEALNCLEKMKLHMELNPQSLFYVFCKAAPERMDFFSEQKNARFIDDKNTYAIWDEILGLVNK